MKRFLFEETAKQDLRAIPRQQAFDILLALTRLAREDAGDVTQLHGDLRGYHRLRAGDWRVLFKFEEKNTIHVYRVGNRRDVYSS